MQYWCLVLKGFNLRNWIIFCSKCAPSHIRGLTVQISDLAFLSTFFCGQLNTRLERFRFKEKVCMTEKSESFYFHFVYAWWYFWFRSSLGSGQLRLGGQQKILQKSLLELLVPQKVQVVSEIKSGGWVAHSTQPVRSRREVAKRLQWLHAGRASRILAV